MLIEEARELVDAYVERYDLKLGPDALWYESSFEDGWLLVSDRGLVASAHHFTVLDTGQVHHDEGSLPPQWYAAKHSRLGEDVEITVVSEGLSRPPLD